VLHAGLCSHTVITMPEWKSALEALAMMQEHDISGIAVVDKAGRLLGNFSMSELRTIRVEHFGALALPVAEFLALSHGADYSSGKSLQVLPSIDDTCFLLR
jgi:CBS-domain-containing membrane protein